MARRPRYTEQQVRDAVRRSPSITQALRRLGLRAAGGNFATMRALIAAYGLATDHFDPNWSRRANRPRTAMPLGEILVDGSNYNRTHLKRRLYAEGLKPRRCEFCGQGELWRGRSMSLILDHINGVATDNRIENLRIICPNCAATLETHCARKNRIQRDPRVCLHCGKAFVPKYPAQRYCSQICGTRRAELRQPRPATRKVLRPSYDQLNADLEEMSFVKVGQKYGVSDNAIRKWLRSYEYEREAESRTEAAAHASPTYSNPGSPV